MKINKFVLYTLVYLYLYIRLQNIRNDFPRHVALHRIYTSGFYNLNPAFINLNTLVFNLYPLKGYLECYTIRRNS
jgi:hypothetical protein